MFLYYRMILLSLLFFLPMSVLAEPKVKEPPISQAGCTRKGCHAQIEAIVSSSSEMGKALRKLALRMNDKEGCVPCHGGDPNAETKETSHQGLTFYPDPGSPWINASTCGQCHKRHVNAQWNSLMMTEAGKIQGVYWAFGSKLGYQHLYGNYDAKNPKYNDSRVGSELYQVYMERLAQIEPNVFPSKLKALPDLPDVEAVKKDPTLAKLTYLRSECQRCHLGVRGRQERGDYRGMGCSACHIPYSNEGFYEGADQAIPKDKRGHLLVHQIQGTRRTKVKVNGIRYSGIPVETCTSCHDRGKRIGVSYQGLMESAFGSPYAPKGKRQPKLHSKRYLALHQDIHYQKGMLCQDCHSSIDVHGDGFLFGANLSQVEIECQDCHGTPTAYPWKLPLGYGEEFEGRLKFKRPRKTTSILSGHEKQGMIYPVEEGYLITTRGNAYPNVVRRGNKVVVHTAGGKDIILEPLKLKLAQKKLKRDARVAMVAVGKHIDSMECYSCHATWAPQCYGCHAKVDYSENKTSFDWVKAGRLRLNPDQRALDREEKLDLKIAGKVQEERSYMRHEEPMLAIDGEGRISPAIPGCQVSVTVIGPDGKDLVRNKIYRSSADTEGGGEKGQLAIDMSPVQPHTTGKARSCESCHASAKAIGYGIGGGKLNRPWNKALTVDIADANQRSLSRHAKEQIAAIDGLVDDWSRIIDEKGQQKMTVGHHFSKSRPLDKKQRDRLDRRGVCLACHQEIPKKSVAINLLHHIAERMDKLPDKSAEHSSLIRKITLFSAWGQIISFILSLIGLILIGRYVYRRYRKNIR